MVRKTLKEIMASPRKIDRAKIAATTEEDIERYRIEDGEDLTADPLMREWNTEPATVRRKLHMTQEAFATALQVPVATIRNWEQMRVTPDPAARALLTILDRMPKAIEVLDGGAANDTGPKREKQTG